MKRHGRPKAVVTDRLRSYGAALKDIGGTKRQEVAHRVAWDATPFELASE